MNKPIFRTFVVALGIVALGFLAWANRTGKLEPSTYRETGTLIPVTSDIRWPAQTIPVTCGMYVQKIYDFSVQTQSYSADGWVWLTWPQAFQDLITSQGIPVEKILDPVNDIQVSAFLFKTADGCPTPRQLPDGRYYQLLRFSGKFFAPNLDFRHFPFESLEIPVIFGFNSEIPALNIGHARLVADAARSGIGQFTNISGYITTGQRVEEFVYQFQDRFGLPTTHPDIEARFSRVELNAIYHTSTTAAILQLLLPLAVVLTILLLAPNLTGSLWNVRTVIPPSLLVALVFQQQNYRTRLPQLPYLTFMDQLYSVSFAFALIIFGLFVWGSNRLDGSSANERPAIVDEINRVDFRVQIGLIATLAALITFAWFVPGSRP